MPHTPTTPIEPDFVRQVQHADLKRLSKYCYDAIAHVPITHDLLQQIRDEVALTLGLNVKVSPEALYTTADGRQWLGHITITRDGSRYRFYFPLVEDGVQGLQHIELHIEADASNEGKVIHSQCHLLHEASRHVMRTEARKRD